MIFFLTVTQVIAIHDRQLEEYGSLAGFRDIGLIEGMISRVENLHVSQAETDLFMLAASLLLSIARGHGFNDANKRTSAAAAMIFLDINGVSIRPGDGFADYVVEAAQGIHDVYDVAKMLKSMVQQ